MSTVVKDSGPRTYENSYLGFSLDELRKKGASLTAREISHQPGLWLKTWDTVYENSAELQAFLTTVFAEEGLLVILTGAGSSAFIGSALQGPFQHHTGKHTVAIATTDLISHPENYFDQKKTLLISFARSGESPESVAALELADRFCKKVWHLVITCNPEGKLAKYIAPDHKNARVLLMPKEADDQSLAMTGSFTAMLLSGLLISRMNELKALKRQVQQLAQYGNNILIRYAGKLKEIAHLDFKRAVFLGSGPLRAVANESDLKVQELTAGKVICKFDSFLGFRHGPKAVINSSTLIVYLFSNNKFVQQYELDLVKAIASGEKGLYSVGVSEDISSAAEVDLMIRLSDDEKGVDEELLSICTILPAQILGFYKSLELGLTPDDPSENATITRVVQGVIIYPFPENNS